MREDDCELLRCIPPFLPLPLFLLPSPSLCLCRFPYTNIYAQLFVYDMCVSVCLLVCLSICMSVYLQVCDSVYLHVCLFICLFLPFITWASFLIITASRRNLDNVSTFKSIYLDV